MPRNNAINSELEALSDGFRFGAGNPTKRDLQVVGGDVEVTADNAAVYTYPNATDTVVLEAYSQTLTNKTIDADNNTITNIGASEVEPGVINDHTVLTTVDKDNDYLLVYDASANDLKKTTIRNLLSEAGEYGEMYLSDNTTATSISATNTPVKVAGSTSAGLLSSSFSHSSGRLTYTGANSGKFLVTVAMSLELVGSNDKVKAYVAKNGTIQSKSEINQNLDATGDVAVLPINAIVELTDTDYIEVFIANETTTDNITVSYMNVSVVELAGTLVSASGGATNVYAYITDGSVTAAANGSDTIKFRSSDNSLAVTVGSNDVTHGDNVDLAVASVGWSLVTSTPTTLGGYGITDAYTQTQLQTSGSASVHWNNITNVPTYDNYNAWNISVDGSANDPIASGNVLSFNSGSNVTLSYNASSNTVTINATSSFTGWTVAGDTGSEAINSGETITWAGGTGISTAYNDTTNTLTITNDITTLVSLSDTPNNYTGSGNYLLRVNAVPDGVEFVDPASIGVGTFNDDGTYDNYGGWIIDDGTTSETIGSGDTLNVTGTGGATVTYDDTTNTLTIDVATGGGFTSFDISDGNNTESIANANTITFTGTNGIKQTVSATDTVTTELFFHTLTNTSPNQINTDLFVFYDGSNNEYRATSIYYLNLVLDHNALVNRVAAEHVNHTAVSIAGVQSLTGGGTIDASRTLSLVNDNASPGSNRYYGTNSAGNKGWHSFPGAESLADTLAVGNITGGNPIVMTYGDNLTFKDSGGTNNSAYINMGSANQLQFQAGTSGTLKATGFSTYGFYNATTFLISNNSNLVDGEYFDFDWNVTNAKFSYLDGNLDTLSLVFEPVAGTTDIIIPTSKNGTLGYYDEIGGNATNALVTTPSASQDGYAITWDNANQEYTLTNVTGTTGATRKLDNLTVTAVNADIDPNVDNQISLGSGSLSWKNVYTRRISSSDSLMLSSSTDTHIQIVAAGTGNFIINRDTNNQGRLHESGAISATTISSASNISITMNSQHYKIVLDYDTPTAYTLSISSMLPVGIYYVLIDNTSSAAHSIPNVNFGSTATTILNNTISVAAGEKTLLMIMAENTSIAHVSVFNQA